MLLTVKQVQQQLNVSRALVYRLIERGELASHRIGKSIRVSEEDLEAYLQKSKVQIHHTLDTKVGTSRMNNLQL